MKFDQMSLGLVIVLQLQFPYLSVQLYVNLVRLTTSRFLNNIGHM